MILAIVGVVVSGAGLIFGVYKFIWGRHQRSPAQQVADTDRKMMQDEIDRPTNVTDAINRL